MFSSGLTTQEKLVNGMPRSKLHGRPLTIAIIGLSLAVLAVAGMAQNWYSTQGTPSATLTAGQFVTITGTLRTGYGTIGCVPQSGQSTCAVPQIASLQDYLRSNMSGMWFVIQWKQSAGVQLIDGQTVTVSGILEGIAYSSSPGATFPIYHLNNQTSTSGLLQPQPSFEITNAVLD